MSIEVFYHGNNFLFPKIVSNIGKTVIEMIFLAII